MTGPSEHSKIHLLLAGFVTIANIALVWFFRYLPLYDYPIWLYHVKTLHHLSDPLFSHAFTLVEAPIPNLGFIGPLWLLSTVFTLETAGKILLSVCVAGFPWSVYFLVKRFSGNSAAPLAFIGFPFAFNFYFFGGHAFLLALIIMLLLVGLFLPAFQVQGVKRDIALSAGLVVLFFAHGLVFAMMMFQLFVYIVIGRIKLTDKRAIILFGPAGAVLGAYFLMSSSPLTHPLNWSVWGAIQNFAKPLLLFTKSFGVSPPVPLTFFNGMWIALLGLFVILQLRSAGKSGRLDLRVLVAGVGLLLLGVTMPGFFLGIAQPGVRFGLLAGILILLSSYPGVTGKQWRTIFLCVSLGVAAYNGYHFSEVNRQMKAIVADIQSSVTLRNKAFSTIRVDWPTKREVWDGFAAPVNPMFGAVYYASLVEGGPAWVFDSGLLRAVDETIAPEFEGETIEAYVGSVTAAMLANPKIDVLVITGYATPMSQIANGLRDSGRFAVRSEQPLWMVLERVDQSAKQGP